MRGRGRRLLAGDGSGDGAVEFHLLGSYVVDRQEVALDTELRLEDIDVAARVHAADEAFPGRGVEAGLEATPYRVVAHLVPVDPALGDRLLAGLGLRLGRDG